MSRLKDDPRTWGLYVVTDRTQTTGRPLEEVTRAALAGGARVFQLREKDLEARELTVLAERLLGVIRSAGGLLLVNDRIDVATPIRPRTAPGRFLSLSCRGSGGSGGGGRFYPLGADLLHAVEGALWCSAGPRSPEAGSVSYPSSHSRHRRHQPDKPAGGPHRRGRRGRGHLRGHGCARCLRRGESLAILTTFLTGEVQRSGSACPSGSCCVSRRRHAASRWRISASYPRSVGS